MSAAVAIFVHNAFDPIGSREAVPVEPGVSIRGLLAARGIEEFATPTVATLNGTPVLRGAWGMTHLQDHDVLAFVPVLQGGGGGGGKKNPLRTVLMISVMVAAVAFGPALGAAIGIPETVTLFGSEIALAGVVGGGIISLGGSLIVNALVPPPAPTVPSADFSSRGAAPAPSPTYSLQGQGNQARLGQPKPVLYGRHRIVPDLAAQPWAEFQDNDQYLHSLFYVSQGQVDIEEVLIAQTPIGNFAEVETEIVTPGAAPTLFDPAMATATEVAGQDLKGPNELDPGEDGWVGPFTANDAETTVDTIAIDVVLPRGLYYANSSGGLDQRTATWTVEARPLDDDGVPTGAWQVLAAAESLSDATTTPIRRSYSYPVSAGRYEVRAKRTNNRDLDSRAGDIVEWHGLRAHVAETPNYGDATLLAVRMRATDNLSSRTSRAISVIGTRMLPVWDAVAQGWSAPQATRSIVWAYCDVARARYGGRLDDSAIDLDGLAALDAAYAARGDTFDAVFDAAGTVPEALATIARVGRAVRIQQGMRLTMVRDDPKTLPSAMFTGRNIARGSMQLTFLMPTRETADLVTVEYINPKTWKPTEVSMRAFGARYQDWLTANTLADTPEARRDWIAAGKAAEGADGNAVRFRLFGCTQKRMAEAEAWYMVQANVRRRTEVSFATEAEGLLPSYGDLAAVAHDLPAWGAGGEIVAYHADTRILHLSEPVTFGDGAHYLGLRGPDGSVQAVVEVEPIAPTATQAARQVRAVVAIDQAVEIETGDDRERTHYAFGAGEEWAARCKIMTLRPRENFRVEVHAVVDHPDVYSDPPEIAA